MPYKSNFFLWDGVDCETANGHMITKDVQTFALIEWIM